MPLAEDGYHLESVAGGLYDRQNPSLIGDDQCASVRNVHFNRGSAEEAKGYRKLNHARPPMGAPRFQPATRRFSSQAMTRWRDGHAYAPYHTAFDTVPAMVEAHFRIEQPTVYPATGTGPATVQRLHAPLTGRTANVIGTTRTGGEHQVFPIVTRGAREVEEAAWGLVVGVLRPIGLKNNAGVSIADPDCLFPIFYWWEEATFTLKFAAANVTIFPGQDYHVAVKLGHGGGAGTWYVNGVAATELTGDDIFPLPQASALSTGQWPIYFGRSPTREPGVSYTQIERKHAYLGRWGIAVTGSAATTITMTGSQLGFTGAAATSYVRWRVRDTVGGNVWIISASVFAGPDTFTFTIPNGHGLAPGSVVDIIPPVEPVPVDCTIQDVRLWRTAPSAAVIAALAKVQLFSERESTRPDRNPFRSAAFGDQDDTSLLAYWPMNEDGGFQLREHIAGAHAFFGPSVIGRDRTAAAPSTTDALALDGETAGIHVPLADDPNLERNWLYNLGRLAGTESHWNLCVRMEFLLGSAVIGTTAGTIQQHVYQVLASFGDPATGPLFECRYTNFGGGTPGTLYFALPDGTYQTLTGVTLRPGVWYSAILGIEALAAASNTHYCYFQAWDPSGTVTGGFTASFTLNSQTAKDGVAYRLVYGASVRGQDTIGVQRHNHAMLLLGTIAYGFHPAHKAATNDPSNLIEWIDVDPLGEAMEAAPLLQQASSGVTFTKGSRSVTTVNGESIPTYARRWPLLASQVDFVYRQKDEADQLVLDNLIIRSASSATASLARTYEGETISGVSVRLQTWIGLCRGALYDPEFDTDMNAARESATDLWALTKKTPLDALGSLPGFAWGIDPTYEFLSPLKIAPAWTRGIVKRLDLPITAMKLFKRDNGEKALAVVAAGSLWALDERWRKGAPFDQNGRSFAFRRIQESDALRLEEEAPLLRLYPSRGRVPPNEAVRLPTGYGKLDPAETFATNTGYFFEAWVRLDALDGIRTLGAAVQALVASDGSVNRWLWKKNWHWYLDNGSLVFEIVNQQTAVAWRAVMAVPRPNAIRPGRWTCVAAFLAGAAGSITGCTFFIDGKAFTATVTGGPLAMANVPTVTSHAYLGAAGDPASAMFADGLGGRMAGFRILTNRTAADYQREVITDEDATGTHLAVPMSEGQGVLMRTSLGAAESATFIGNELVHVGSGMGDCTGREVALEVFGGVLYLTNLITRPWRYDGDELTPAGLRPPVGQIRSAAVVRRPLRIRGLGAEVPSSIGSANRTSLVPGAGPHLTLFAGASPVANAADIGALVYIPTDPDQNNGGVTDTPGDYIGVVTAVTTAGTYTLNPTPYPEQAAAAADVAWTLFKRAVAAAPSNALSYLDAIQRLESTSPYGTRRLRPDGKDDNDIPTTEDLTTVITAGNAFHFRGSQYVECPPFVADGMPYGVDDVLHVKGYLRLDEIDVLGDNEQVLAEHAIDAASGSWRLVMFGGGRLRFEFFDVTIGAMRSIQTVGKVLSPKQWFYVELCYRFKEHGRCIFDTRGGWEPDLRWFYKSNAGTQLQKSRNYRDMLRVYACEGLHLRNENIVHASPTNGYVGDVDDPVPCLLQTLPGCHGQVGAGAAAVARATPAAWNHSQLLLNHGLHRDRPFLTPERGDAFFPATGASANVDSGITLTLLTQTIQSITTGIAAVNFTVPAGFCIPRTCSMNRDDAFDRNHTNLLAGTQIAQNAVTTKWYNQATGPTAVVTATPNLANAVLSGDSYGRKEGWAVLVRVWTIVATGGGAGVVGGAVDVVAGSGDPARVLALVHVGSNDLGNSARGGVAGHSVYLTDDTAYGGDGGGPLRYGGALLAVGAQVHATFELQNGANQSLVSTNRLVCPTLLEHGTNPVGIGDSPDTSSAPVRFGGTVEQGSDGQIKNGVRGRMKHWGFAVLAVVPSTTAIYTGDQLAPDAFFHGPADTRIASLPRLCFVDNANIRDDTGNAWSGTPATRATLVVTMDDLSGDAVLKDSAASASQSPNGSMRRDGGGIQEAGVHRFRVTFYDAKQLVESNPGPEYVVAIEGQERAGDELEAESVFALVGLPISGERRRRLGRRVYKTFPDGGVPYLFAEVDDNDTVSLTPRSDRRWLAQGKVLEVDNGRAPYCRALRATESHMAYGGLDDAPSVVAWSKAFKPEHVPGSPIGFCESGRGGPVVGLGFLRGNLVPVKRNALFVSQHQGQAIQTQRVESAIGALNHNSFADIDASLFHATTKGVYIFVGNQTTWPTSEVIERLYRKGLDLERMALAQGAAHIDRAQYLITAFELGAEEPRLVLTCERRRNQFGDWNYVWSVLEPGIPLFSLAEYEDPFSEATRIVAGSLGYVLLFDDGQGVGVQDGALTGTVGPTTSTTELTIVGLDAAVGGIFQAGDGIAGVPIILLKDLKEDGTPAAHGDEDTVEAVTVETLKATPSGNTGVVVIPREEDSFTQYSGWRAIIGGHQFHWTSAELTAGMIDRVKSHRFVDLWFDPVAGGVVYLDVYGDKQLWRCIRVPLDLGYFSASVSDTNARSLQFRTRGYGLPAGFALHKAQVRLDPQAYGARQQQ